MAMRRTTVDGRTVNVRTAQMLKRAQARLGMDLTVIQGSYNAGGVSASAGTHDGGGAVDLSVRDYSYNTIQRVVKALRDVGFAAWYRTSSQGPWSPHVHAIAIGDDEMSSGARSQVDQYYNGTNGLAGRDRDDGPRVSPIPVWPVKLQPVSLARIQNQFKAEKPRKVLAIRRLQHVLNYRLGTDLLEDGVAGPQTRAAYKRWEEKMGVKEPDKKPGLYQLKKLFAGWFVVAK